MQTDIRPTEQLTVHLVDSATMTWAVVQNGNRVHEGSFETCEGYLDWHHNCLQMQSAEAVATEAVDVSSEDSKDLARHGIAAFLDSLFARPNSMPARP